VLAGLRMNHPRIAVMSAAALALVPRLQAAFPIVIDDFAGGPHLANLNSLAAPEIATGSFLHAGAVGGVRDVFVISESLGIFSAGVALGQGGYASFDGSGQGGIVWDAVSGPVDKDGDGDIDIADLDFGLSLDLVQDCPQPLIHAVAFADLPNASLNVFLATGPGDYAIYEIPITSVGSFANYFADLFNPTLTVGTFDPTDVRAIALYHDGGDFDNLGHFARSSGLRI